jgi:hypothetical protein
LSLPDISQQIADGLEITQSFSFPEGTVFSVSTLSRSFFCLFGYVSKVEKHAFICFLD